MSNDLKTQVCDALAAWIRQRPGLRFETYGDIKLYSAAARTIARDRRDAEMMLVAVRNNSGITADMMIDASTRAYVGRLKITPIKGNPDVHKSVPVACEASEAVGVDISYDIGQFRPAEYRKAVAAVLAYVLRTTMREQLNADIDNRQFVNLRAEFRAYFRKEFGSNVQRRWFA